MHYLFCLINRQGNAILRSVVLCGNIEYVSSHRHVLSFVYNPITKSCETVAWKPRQPSDRLLIRSSLIDLFHLNIETVLETKKKCIYCLFAYSTQIWSTSVRISTRTTRNCKELGSFFFVFFNITLKIKLVSQYKFIISQDTNYTFLY